MIKKLKSLKTFWSLNIAALFGWLSGAFFTFLQLRLLYNQHFPVLPSDAGAIILAVVNVGIIFISTIPISIGLLADCLGFRVNYPKIIENRFHIWFFTIGLLALLVQIIMWKTV